MVPFRAEAAAPCPGHPSTAGRPPAHRPGLADRARPALALLALLLGGLAVAAFARAGGGCPSDSLFYDLGEVRRSQAVQPTLMPNLYIWGPLANVSISWQIDPFSGQSRLGAHLTSGELAQRDRFDVVASAPGGAGTTRLVAHLHLQGQAYVSILHGAASQPAGRFFARLETPGGAQSWEVRFAEPGTSGMDLVSEPFPLLAGEFLEVAWALGVDNTSGGSDLTGYLTFDALSDAGLNLVPCEGPPVALTPARPMTWGGIKALFR